MKPQAEHTERSLGALSLRAQRQERVRSLANGGVEAMSAPRRSATLYWLKQNPAEEVANPARGISTRWILQKVSALAGFLLQQTSPGAPKVEPRPRLRQFVEGE